MKKTFLFSMLLITAACSTQPNNQTNMQANNSLSNTINTNANQPTAAAYNEKYRPQFHFTPAAMWMNDPNGMVYNEGVYHLFFQQNPTENVAGNIHWGHATSKDLVHWEQQKTAFAPDELGLIFSGSAVVDKTNSSGFGADGKTPLLAFYASHSVEKEKQKAIDVENQSMAYSLDNGVTWTKYEQNPVLKNPGIKDFRDPKVFWYAPENKWVMAVAAADRIQFYSSKDAKTWTKESEFGEKAGAHGGVWECPDLFELAENNAKKWVLIVNINPGGLQGGSATQYFIGDFDGKTFTTEQTETKWLDYGADDYAGVTWSNTGARKIFLGWMSNWNYGQKVPTDAWRGAMTVPRDLSLRTVGGKHFVTTKPVAELDALHEKAATLDNTAINGSFVLSDKVDNTSGRFHLKFDAPTQADWSIVLSNAKNEQIVVGYSKAENNFYIDRTKSGDASFGEGFAAIHKAPKLGSGEKTDVEFLVDSASVEFFADGGLTSITDIFFPSETLNKIELKAAANITISHIEFWAMKSIWK